MIRVLIAEDSEVTAMLLRAVVQAAPDMEVVGVARDGREAVRMAQSLKPDIVTMDIRMPVMDGFEATRKIMSSNPRPIVVVSASLENEDMKITFKAVEAGALAVLEKPPGFEDPDFKGDCRDMVNMIRVMSSVKVQKRKSYPSEDKREDAITVDSPLVGLPASGSCELVVIGCSLGGPQALQTLLCALPADFPVPIVIIQHISAGFLGGLLDWLNVNSELTVKQVEDKERLLAGTIYVAPDNVHLLMLKKADGLRAVLNDEAPVHSFRPSATVLLKSVASACAGRAVGILLSGMGRDGAAGLLEMREAGCTTLVQDKDSAVIYGMPGAALKLNAVDHVVEIDKMADRLVRIVAVGRPAGDPPPVN